VKKRNFAGRGKKIIGGGKKIKKNFFINPQFLEINVISIAKLLLTLKRRPKH
jgi:hypothetical protein